LARPNGLVLTRDNALPGNPSIIVFADVAKAG